MFHFALFGTALVWLLALCDFSVKSCFMSYLPFFLSHILIVVTGFVQFLKVWESLGELRCHFPLESFGKMALLSKVLESFWKTVLLSKVLESF